MASSRTKDSESASDQAWLAQPQYRNSSKMNAVTDRQSGCGAWIWGPGKSMASPVSSLPGGGWPRMTLLIHAEPLDRRHLDPCSPRVKEARGNLPHTQSFLYGYCRSSAFYT